MRTGSQEVNKSHGQKCPLWPNAVLQVETIATEYEGYNIFVVSRYIELLQILAEGNSPIETVSHKS